jgi:hypothetical protein
MEQEIEELRGALAQKENVEIFYGEAIERSKEQINQKDLKLDELTQMYDKEKELRIREEVQTKNLINSMR